MPNCSMLSLAKTKRMKKGIAGNTNRFSKNAKSTKDPICDCGKPESKCTCSGHNHKKSIKMSKLFYEKKLVKTATNKRNNNNKYFR